MRSSCVRYILLLMVIAVNVTGCVHDEDKHEAVVTTYTCPMHPQIVQEQPGTCPVCGMDLVVFDRSDKNKRLVLSEQQVALANITTAVVGDTSISSQMTLNGRVATDPENTRVISARIRGRIEALYVKETGTNIRRGQPLYRIFSEELASLQQEYLLAAAQARAFPDDQQFQRIEKAARQKLILYGQSTGDVDRLLRRNSTVPYTEVTAPGDGVVSNIAVAEGAYVDEGTTVMELEDYANVWIEADVYPNERHLIRPNMDVDVRVPGVAELQPLTVIFINPEMTPGRQVTTIRGRLKSAALKVQPGMPVSVILPVKGVSQTKALPSNAVIRSASGAHVWVEIAPREFEPRVVETGNEDMTSTEVTKGLNNGDKVVVTGAYLLYSEYVLKKNQQPM